MGDSKGKLTLSLWPNKEMCTRFHSIIVCSLTPRKHMIVHIIHVPVWNVWTQFRLIRVQTQWELFKSRPSEKVNI
jgi:hypothetical protein